MCRMVQVGRILRRTWYDTKIDTKVDIKVGKKAGIKVGSWLLIYDLIDSKHTFKVFPLIFAFKYANIYYKV